MQRSCNLQHCGQMWLFVPMKCLFCYYCIVGNNYGLLVNLYIFAIAVMAQFQPYFRNQETCGSIKPGCSTWKEHQLLLPIDQLTVSGQGHLSEVRLTLLGFFFKDCMDFHTISFIQHLLQLADYHQQANIELFQKTEPLNRQITHSVLMLPLAVQKWQMETLSYCTQTHVHKTLFSAEIKEA